MIYSIVEDEEYADYHPDDFVNHPDVVTAVSILARRALEYQNSISRQGFLPRQGPFGPIRSILQSQGSVIHWKTQNSFICIDIFTNNYKNMSHNLTIKVC